MKRLTVEQLLTMFFESSSPNTAVEQAASRCAHVIQVLQRTNPNVYKWPMLLGVYVESAKPSKANSKTRSQTGPLFVLAVFFFSSEEYCNS